MMTVVMQAILDLLNGDGTLTGYLGASSRCLLGWVNQDTIFPCVTVYEGSETSVPRVTYLNSKHRDCNPSVLIDTWVDRNHVGFPCTSLDLNTIADRVDELIFTTDISNTYGWVRSSSVELQENTTSTRLIHKSRRYEFMYSVQDT
jgi:hypothetical protein